MFPCILCFLFSLLYLLVFCDYITLCSTYHLRYQRRESSQVYSSSSCVFGISFTFHPNWVRRYLPQKKNREKNTTTRLKRSFQGHHPDCHTFQNHTIQWRHKTWCAGCLGLLIGLCVSILLMILYIITDFTQLKNDFLSVVYPWIVHSYFCILRNCVSEQTSNSSMFFSNSMLPISFFHYHYCSR